ncbi:competence type IV pilus minor pilin ComGE [Sporolactobacillus vineae]|uniref:competence type IV pilus minor pilin ComGE n=1 Tax=Sporolactobacillus vineae TaxID=444463 RepID=UPI000287C7F7|nr:competence type IV pilus minor pilin ComGE [Sporolactobacillus vineae]
MKNSNRGIFLTEVMVSLTLLTVLMVTAIPSLTHIYQERTILQQKTEALQVLRYHLMHWKAGETTVFPELQPVTDFSLVWEKKTDHEALLSIHWSDGPRQFTIRSEARK